ncbi:hypothetical protein EDD86DRAFT_201864 [Gorgonomyces haynaldii]|nr:hypothetical protein EDD86DRAFT_201864 [Gorgonomyces haynaldii]
MDHTWITCHSSRATLHQMQFGESLFDPTEPERFLVIPGTKEVQVACGDASGLEPLDNLFLHWTLENMGTELKISILEHDGIRLVFPNAVVGRPFVFVTECIVILVLCGCGTLYRIIVKEPWFKNLDLSCISKYTVQGLVGHTVMHYHCPDLDTAVIVRKDGTCITVEYPPEFTGSVADQMEQDTLFAEHELIDSSYISHISSFLKPRNLLSALNLAKDRPDDVEIISLASLCFGDQITLFTLSRGGKLKVWNLVTKTCMKTIALEKNDLLQEQFGDYIQIFNTSQRGDNPDPFDSNAVVFDLLVLLPFQTAKSEFCHLAFELDVQGQVQYHELGRIASQAPVDMRLVDFLIAGRPDGCHCWSLWDDHGNSAAFHFELPLEQTRAVPRWNQVSMSDFQTNFVDHLVVTESIDQAYLEMILHPGRYKNAVFKQLLPQSHLSLPLGHQIQRYVADIIVPSDQEESKDYFEQNKSQMISSWNLFMNRLNQLQAQAMAPSSIFHHPTLDCIVVCRKAGSIGFIRTADPAEILTQHSMLQSRAQFPSQLRPSLHDISHIKTIASHIKKRLVDAQAFRELEQMLWEQASLDLEIGGLLMDLNSRLFRRDSDEYVAMASLYYKFGDLESAVEAVIQLAYYTHDGSLVSQSRLHPQLLSSCFSASVQARYHLLLSTWLITIWTHGLDNPLPLPLVKRLLETCIVFSKLVWLSRAPYESVSSEQLVDRFAGQLSLQKKETSQTLLEHLFHNHVFINEGPATFSENVLHSALEFLRQLGFLQDPTEATVQVAKKLLAYKQYSGAKKMLGAMPRTSAVLSVLAQTHLGLKEYELSRYCFELSVSQTGYESIVHLYAEADVYDLAVYFAELAYALNHTPHLAQLIFNYALHIGDVTKAYNALLNVAPENRKNCLDLLITHLAETKNFRFLCERAFPNLALELEQTLRFKARSQRVESSKHLYHEMCYAHYVCKGNFKSASAVMYQYCQKIHQLEYHDKQDSRFYLNQLCQSYLKALESLSILDVRDQWIADPDRPSGDLLVDVKELRKAYTLSLAKLALLKDAPHLSTTYLLPDPYDVLVLYMRQSRFEDAILIARLFDLDLAGIFRSLAEKALHGTPVEELTHLAPNNRNWLYLKSLLERYDSAEDGFVLTKTTVSHLLELNPNLSLPNWLTRPLMRSVPGDLIRIYCSFERLEDAMKCAESVMEVRDLSVGGIAADDLHALFKP